MNKESTTSPVRSMTGFGMGTAEQDGRVVMVELRSVNHRGRKLYLRTRPALGAFEKDVRDRIQAELARGAIDCHITCIRPIGSVLPQAQVDWAGSVIHSLRHLANNFNLTGDLQARDLLRVPGLFDLVGEKPLEEEELPLVLDALDLAMRQLLTMRRDEGAATAESLLALVTEVETFAEHARGVAPGVVTRQRDRLRARMAELLPDGVQEVDERSLEREICLFADRADIHEEMERLASHVAQFRGVIAAGGEVGKRLEFLAQEFLREINTTASKAGDAAIISRAVDAKLAVEKMKEQAANLE